MIAWYYLVFFALFCLVGFFVSFVRGLLKENKDLKQHCEALSKQIDAERAASDDYIQDLENEKEEMAQGYSVMALMLEEHTTQLADVHKELDELVSRVDQLGNIHIRIAPMMPLPEYEYAEPHEEDAMTPTLPLPLNEWIQNVEGLDEL